MTLPDPFVLRRFPPGVDASLRLAKLLLGFVAVAFLSFPANRRNREGRLPPLGERVRVSPAVLQLRGLR